MRIDLSLIAKIFLGITGLYWFLVLTSIVGITDFLNGRFMEAGAGVVTGIMLVLPVVALLLLMQTRGDDDRAQVN